MRIRLSDSWLDLAEKNDLSGCVRFTSRSICSRISDSWKYWFHKLDLPKLKGCSSLVTSDLGSKPFLSPVNSFFLDSFDSSILRNFSEGFRRNSSLYALYWLRFFSSS